MKNLIKINNFIGKLAPKLDVAGLEISDGLVRFYSLGRREGKARHILLRLAPGVVVNGKVANGEALQSTLVELHKRVSNNQKKLVSVVVSIPINNIYIQPFNLPMLAKDNLKESAELNMRMISPVEVSKAYYDWQEIGENLSKDQLDMVGAFVAKDVADKFIEVLQGANFSVAAVEFSSLSLIRAALRNGFVSADIPSLVLQMDQGGLSFAISHLGGLYFHYFTEWDRYRGADKNIDVAKFKDGVVDEVRKLINFYLTNFKTEDIKNILIVAENLTEEVKAALQSTFPGAQIRTANFNEVNSAHGAALRGGIIRSQDSSISLANLNAIDVFRKGQIANFVSIWRNLAFTTFGFLLLVFLGSAILLQQTAERVKSNDPFANDSENSAKLVRLEKQAEEFNSNVKALQALSSNAGAVYLISNKLTALMGASVDLRRMTIAMATGSITIGGSAKTEELARAFKDKLQNDGQFVGVELPLQDFKPQIDGTVEFLVRAKLEGIDS